MNIKHTLLLSLSLFFINNCTSDDSQKFNDPLNYTPAEISTTKPTNATILAIGQSNMDNSGVGFYYTSSQDVLRVGSDYEFYLPESPITHHALSFNTFGGTFLPLLGDLLVENDKYNSVVYANVSVGGSTISQWTPENPDGHFHKIKTLSEQGFKFTHIIFHQGESDAKTMLDTHPNDYKYMFIQMLKGIRSLGIDAPIYVARASYILGVIDTDITNAQTELIETYSDIFPGPSTDLLGSEYRYDDVHFNKEGLIEHANMWNNSIK